MSNALLHIATGQTPRARCTCFGGAACGATQTRRVWLQLGASLWAFQMIACTMISQSMASGATRGEDPAMGWVGADLDVVSVVRAELRDLGLRAALQGAGAPTAGPGGFVVADGDDRFRLRIGGYTQFRYMASLAEAPDGGDDFGGGFKLQRTRLVFSGTLAEGWDYFMLPSAGPNGEFSLLDAWGRFSVSDSALKVRFGQFKLPIWREWVLSERTILAVERSQLTGVYSSLYAQGGQLEYQDDLLRVHAAVSDGLRSANSEIDAPGEADYAFTLGIDRRFGGNWRQFEDFTPLGTGEPGLLLSLGAHVQGETASFRGVELDRLVQVAGEASWEAPGWSVMGAVIARWLDRAEAPTEESLGVLVQGAALITDDLEVFARYEAIIPGDGTGADELFDAVTVGVNHYIAGQALKVTLDGVWFTDDPAGTSVIGLGQDTSTGLLGGREGAQGVLRVQLQLVF